MAGAWERPSTEVSLGQLFPQGQGKGSSVPQETETLRGQALAQGHSALCDRGLLTLTHRGADDGKGQLLWTASDQ